MQYVKDELEKELNKLKEEPVSEEELEEVKSHLKYDFAMEIDNPTEIAEQLTYFIWVSGDPNALNTYYDTMESLTPADIQAAAQKYFTADKLTIATISPSEEGGVQ
jgi:zinc protease